MGIRYQNLHLLLQQRGVHPGSVEDHLVALERSMFVGPYGKCLKTARDFLLLKSSNRHITRVKGLPTDGIERDQTNRNKKLVQIHGRRQSGPAADLI